MRTKSGKKTQPFRRQQKPNHPTSWNHVADWYGGYLSRENTIQKEIVWPGALRLLGVGKDRAFLDIACGEGSFVAMIAKQGGEVVGIDAAPALIERAKSKKIRGATFFVLDAERFGGRFNNLDGASCILALQNIKDMHAVFQNATRALKKGAPFVIVLNHPAFRIPRQSSWGFEEARKLQYRRIDSYLTENAIPIQMRPGDAPSVKTLSYHRPLQSYVAALASAGFVVDAMEEWTSNKTSDSGPRAKAENHARTEIPLFMAIRARKQ